jgi:hypothetical protein
VNHLLCSGSKARWCPSCPLIALSKSAWSLSHLLYNTNKVYWIEKGGGKSYLKICAELSHHCCFRATFRWQQWQHSAFPWMMHTESLFSIIDGKWMLRFAQNHQEWEGVDKGLEVLVRVACGMDTPK